MKTAILLILLLSLLLLTSNLYAESHQGVELVSRVHHWHQLNDLAVQDDHAYLATGTTGLHIVDVSDPENPEIVSAWFKYPDEVGKVRLYGDYAYVLLNDEDGLYIIDISEPDNPQSVRRQFWDQQISDIVITGEYGYMLADGRLYVLDMTDPTLPEMIGDVGSHASRVFAQGENVYCIGAVPDLTIYNVSDPEDIRNLGQLDIRNARINCLVVLDNYAIAGTSDDEIIVVDVSDEEQPELIGRCQIEGDICDICIQGEIICAACSNQGLCLADICDPENPDLIEQFDTGGEALGVSVFENYAYVIDSEEGLLVIDVSDPDNPETAGLYSSPMGRNIYSIDVAESTACVVGSFDLQLFDIGDPTDPLLHGGYDGVNIAKNVHIYDNYAFLGYRNQRMELIDISDRENPDHAAYYPYEDVRDVYIQNSLAYIARGRSVWILDISDPEHPDQLSRYIFGNNESVYGIYVQDDYAYVATVGNLVVLDIMQPEIPICIDEINTPGPTMDVYVCGDLAYVASGLEGLRIIDVSDPEDMSEIGHYNTRGNALGVIVFNEFAHIADGEGGLRVIDVSDPEHPEEVAFWDTPGYAHNICMSNFLTYVADDNNWSIYDCSEGADYNLPPEWVITPGDTVSVIESEILEFEISASDLNGDTLTLAMNPDDLPDLAGFFDNGDGRGCFHWETTFNDEGTYNPLFSVTDGVFTDTLEVTIVVNHYNLAPYWNVVPYDTIEIMEREAVEFSMAAHDANDAVITLSIRRGRLPDWIEFTDHGDGRCDFSWWTEREDAGIYRPLFIASDGELADTALVTIIVHPYNDAQTEPVVPTELALYPPCPNPFNAVTRIAYAVPTPSHVKLTVYDISGRLVEMLVDEDISVGHHICEFDGAELAAGLYFVRLEFETQIASYPGHTVSEQVVLTRKAVVVK